MKKRFLAMVLVVCLLGSLIPGAGAVPGVIIPPPESPAVEEDSMDSSEFKIDAYGVLSGYTGAGGDVVIPDGVKKISSEAFHNCTTITSLVIPDSVTEVVKDFLHDDPQPFKGCTNLTSITIGNGLTNMYDNLFSGCDNLAYIFIGSGVNYIESYALSGHNLAYIEVAKGNPVYLSQDGVLYSRTDGNVCIDYVPDAITGPVTILDDVSYIPHRNNPYNHSFQGCAQLTSIDVGDGVTALSEYMFRDCTSLTNITIGSSVTEIEQFAFYGCPSLASITVDENNPSFASHDGILYDKEKTKILYTPPAISGTVTIPATVTSGGELLKNCPNLSTLIFAGGMRYCPGYTLPEGVSVVDANGTDLTGFTYEKGVLVCYAGSSRHVVIPEGTKQIGLDREDTSGRPIIFAEGAFANHTEIKSVTIPSSVRTISAKSFLGCTGLTSVDIPYGVSFIDDEAFSGCTNLTKVSFGGSLKTLGDAVFADTGITSLVVPEGVTSCVFREDSTLRELTLPSTLEEAPWLHCQELRKLTLHKDCWPFKGMSRADFLNYISACPRLNTIVNCPNEFVDELIAPNVALRNNWVDPKSTIVPQSARITQLSNQITQGLSSDYDKAKAISQWVVDHIKYDYDYYYEGLKDYSDVPFDPEEILDKGQAVCAGFSRLTQALLVAQKIPCLYVLGDTTAGYHAWNLAVIDGEYLWIDNTWGMDYFGIGVYAISREHWATGAASFNNVKGPGTLVEGEEEKKDDNSGGQQGDSGLSQGGGGGSTLLENENGDGSALLEGVSSVLPEKTGTAHPSTQKVLVDGKAVEFQCYALKNAAGNDTNYIKLRDLADILSGSQAQFEVGWDGKNVTIATGKSYTRNGSEQKTPFSGQRDYSRAGTATLINGQASLLAAFVLNDDSGGGYTYYQLRDLGKALGFNVGWSAEKGIFLESGKPYTDKD